MPSDVALPTEGVDRNSATMSASLSRLVALPTEGVDRNYRPRMAPQVVEVALPTEGVDRNKYTLYHAHKIRVKSPSPRRAWIEILIMRTASMNSPVALPTEGVDRNFIHFVPCKPVLGRPPHGGRG